MCSDFATFIGDRSWHPHWDKRWQTPYPRSPAMVDPLWASMSAEGWRATQDYSRSVSAHWSQRAGGSQGSWNGWWLWRFFKDLHFLEHFGATRKMETCLSDPCGSRFISLNARQARAIQAHWNTVHRHIMRDCRSSIGLKSAPCCCRRDPKVMAKSVEISISNHDPNFWVPKPQREVPVWNSKGSECQNSTRRSIAVWQLQF